MSTDRQSESRLKFSVASVGNEFSRADKATYPWGPVLGGLIPYFLALLFRITSRSRGDNYYMASTREVPLCKTKLLTTAQFAELMDNM